MKKINKFPLLLGRPFLAIEATLIDVHFNLNQSLKQLDFEKDECKNVEKVVSNGSKIIDDCKIQNSMNESMMNFQYIEDLDVEYLNASFELKETVLSMNEHNA